METHPQTGRLCKRKAAASSNLAPRLKQTHTHPHDQGRAGNQRHPLPWARRKAPSTCPSLEDSAICRDKDLLTAPSPTRYLWSLDRMANYVTDLLLLQQLSPGLQSQGTQRLFRSRIVGSHPPCAQHSPAKLAGMAETAPQDQSGSRGDCGSQNPMVRGGGGVLGQAP